MLRKEYLQKISSFQVKVEIVKKIEDIYGVISSEEVKKVVSNCGETIFFDDDYRVLALQEILDAEKDLHVNFKEKEIIPIIDCGENDFIVYHYMDDIWSKFNIIDEIVFKKKESLEDLL